MISYVSGRRAERHRWLRDKRAEYYIETASAADAVTRRCLELLSPAIVPPLVDDPGKGFEEAWVRLAEAMQGCLIYGGPAAAKAAAEMVAYGSILISLARSASDLQPTDQAEIDAVGAWMDKNHWSFLYEARRDLGDTPPAPVVQLRDAAVKRAGQTSDAFNALLRRLPSTSA